jgi:drug/metabolite transporter (DMT)-like permease
VSESQISTKSKITSSHWLAPHLALLAVQLLFGSWPILGKIVLRTISSSSLVVYRLLGAAVVFVLIQRNLKPLLRMRRKDFAWLTLCSVMGIIGNQLLYRKGLPLTTVSNTTLLNTTIPVFTLFVSILFGYDRLSLRRVTGILLAAAGVIYLVNPLRADLSHQTTVGNLLIVCNSTLYSAYIVYSRVEGIVRALWRAECHHLALPAQHYSRHSSWYLLNQL